MMRLENIRRRGARLHRDRRGQALAEMAIVLPILLLLVFGIIEMSSAWRTFQVITNVAREGSRVAILPTATYDDVMARIQNGLDANGLNDPDAEILISCDPGGTGVICTGSGDENTIRIEYPYTFRVLGPLAQWASGGGSGFGTITLASTTIMRKE